MSFRLKTPAIFSKHLIYEAVNLALSDYPFITTQEKLEPKTSKYLFLENQDPTKPLFSIEEKVEDPNSIVFKEAFPHSPHPLNSVFLQFNAKPWPIDSIRYQNQIVSLCNIIAQSVEERIKMEEPFHDKKKPRLRIGAPIQRDASKFREKDETFFLERGMDKIIPDNYVERLNEMIDAIIDGLQQPYYSSQQSNFTCDVFSVTIKLQANNVIIYHVKTRPCAEGCGIYRYFIWKLGQYIVHNNFSSLIVELCSERNIDILKKMGFYDTNDYRYSQPNMTITHSISKEKIKDKRAWNIKDTFPPAKWLNDENFVNRFIDNTAKHYVW